MPGCVHLLWGTKGRESGKDVNILLGWESRGDGKNGLMRSFRVNRGILILCILRSFWYHSALLYTISGWGERRGRQLWGTLKLTLESFSTWKGLGFGQNVRKQTSTRYCAHA